MLIEGGNMLACLAGGVLLFTGVVEGMTIAKVHPLETRFLRIRARNARPNIRDMMPRDFHIQCTPSLLPTSSKVVYVCAMPKDPVYLRSLQDIAQSKWQARIHAFIIKKGQVLTH
jgi:hypothetical protein